MAASVARRDLDQRGGTAARSQACTLLHSTVICMGRAAFAQSTFQCQVPLIKSPVTSGLLYQPHISITSPPQ